MIDVLYLAWNRAAFTEFSLELLLRNTDWALVRRLVVYDDGSTDGTAEWLRRRLAEDLPVAAVLRRTAYRSPVAVMADYLCRDAPADWFAKIDNDVAVPEGWLGELAGVCEREPTVDLLGMEGGWNGPPGHNDAPFRGYYAERCSHIGGVGLMRTAAFQDRPRLIGSGRFGFTEWQHRHEPNRAWIAPDLLVGCLDRVPVDPWASLSARYVQAGWQRPWGTYDPAFPYWWGWFPPDLVARAVLAAG